MSNDNNFARLIDGIRSDQTNKAKNGKAKPAAGPRVIAWGNGEEKPVEPRKPSGAGQSPDKPKDQPSCASIQAKSKAANGNGSASEAATLCVAGGEQSSLAAGRATSGSDCLPAAEAQPEAKDDELFTEHGEHPEPPFARGDHAEIADRLLRRLYLQSKAQVVFADGQLWQYCRATHVYRPATDSKLSRIVQGFAGAKLGEKSVLTHKLR